MNARDNQKVLNNHLVLVSGEIEGACFMFQQNNVAFQYGGK